MLILLSGRCLWLYRLSMLGETIFLTLLRGVLKMSQRSRWRYSHVFFATRAFTNILTRNISSSIALFTLYFFRFLFCTFFLWRRRQVHWKLLLYCFFALLSNYICWWWWCYRHLIHLFWVWVRIWNTVNQVDKLLWISFLPAENLFILLFCRTDLFNVIKFIIFELLAAGQPYRLERDLTISAFTITWQNMERIVDIHSCLLLIISKIRLLLS